MAGHTPGPWRALGNDDRTTADTIPVLARTGFEVADVYGWQTSKHPTMTVVEAEANAHLIAAAPDLYTALKHAIGTIEAHVPEDALGRDPQDGWSMRDMHLHHMRAAIAKAEGR